MSKRATNAGWKLAAWVSGGLSVVSCSTLGFGQGCALCYNNAAASGPHAIQALKSGILVLLVPPVLMFIGIFVVLFRSKERTEDSGL